MLWLPVLLASYSSLAAADSVAKASAPPAPPAPQRRDSPAADTTARDISTKPPRDSAGPDATMKLWPEYLLSEALVSEAVPTGRALSEVCDACTIDHTARGSPCCDAAWASDGYTCAQLSSSTHSSAYSIEVAIEQAMLDVETSEAIEEHRVDIQAIEEALART